MRVRLLALLFAALPLAAQPIPTDRWRADLSFLATELPARHIKPFARISKAEFESQVQSLDTRIPRLSELQIRAEILRLVASIGDGHTRVQSQGRADAFHALPLGLYWFKDGIYVVSASEEYSRLIGGRLAGIGSKSAEEACRAMTPLVPHENDAELRLDLPGRLVTPELLYAVGITDSPESARVSVTAADGTPIAEDVRLLPDSPPRKMVSAFKGETPLYRKNASLSYWFTGIDNGATVYFQYNRCVSDAKQPFPDFRAQLKQALSDNRVQRLVVDMRYNGGGNSAILDPWIAEIAASRFNARGKLFVIIGRNTFSSAILNALRFRNTTKATLVGEPTAGKPNHFGEVRNFDLPNSHITVSYSTKYFRDSKEDTDSLMPDVLAELTFRDYLAGADPALNAIPR
ncbi:MAG TPA: hypothetical protein VKB88_07015 [Bryobacteraceae bacterium]|nr:hypothetical protein [Bryobacteraceae bacterium]